MHCTSCGKEASCEDNFCGKCDKSLASKTSASGDSSVNVAGSNTFSNSTLHVGDIYEGEKPEDKAYVDRTYVKRATILGSPVKPSWFIVSGLIGLIGSFASIFSVLGSCWQFLFIIFAAISMFLLINGVMLWITRFSRFECLILSQTERAMFF